jgi:hypothetical protein
MEGRSEDKKFLSHGEHPCPGSHQFVEGRIATKRFIDRCLVGMAPGWRGCASYCKRHIDEKVGTSSLSGRGWSGTAVGSLGDGEGRWGTKLRTSHGFAPTDVNMNEPCCMVMDCRLTIVSILVYLRLSKLVAR